MKITQTKTEEHQCIIALTCDVCSVTYDNELDLQEFLCLDEVGGYNSAIGDGTHFTCDICSQCMKKLLGQYMSTVDQF